MPGRVQILSAAPFQRRRGIVAEIIPTRILPHAPASLRINRKSTGAAAIQILDLFTRVALGDQIANL